MKLATIDLETDPFEYGKVPKPFAAGFYDGDKFVSYWGPDCVARLVSYLNSLEEGLLIYAHNGGKFDFYYFLPSFSGSLRIINNRIVSAIIGRHELRDSYAILPFALAAYAKDSIDYDKMRSNVRNAHRVEILAYLKKDCLSLHELVTAFHAEFGDGLTVGGTALKQIRKRHKIQTGGEVHDKKFREDFYFGGRVQVFQAGLVNQPVKIYDVNSMYPYVMKTLLHPVGTQAILDKKIRNNTCFVVVEGKNDGAFCKRSETGSLDFSCPGGRFSTTIHEWRAAEETGTFQTTRIVKAIGFDNRITFDEFVSHFYDSRQRAGLVGDKIHALFYKYILNSGYGKFAQNPENFSEYEITERDRLLSDPWAMAYLHPEYIIWKKPTEKRTYYNIVTGASITGAARSLLLRGLHASVDAVYCDTDSIIARSMHGVSVDSSQLGSWKLEGMGTRCAIAGKKLYAIFNDGHPCTCKTATKENPCRRCVKKAHKGAILSYGEIERIAAGEEIICDRAVPAFKLDQAHQFVSRRMRRTV